VYVYGLKTKNNYKPEKNIAMRKIYLIIATGPFTYTFTQDQLVFVRLDKDSLLSKQDRRFILSHLNRRNGFELELISEYLICSLYKHVSFYEKRPRLFALVNINERDEVHVKAKNPDRMTTRNRKVLLSLLRANDLNTKKGLF